MTTIEIDFLLHCHTTPCAHVRSGAPAIKDATAKFLKMGLIRYVDIPGAASYLETTSLGAEMVARLKDVKIPKYTKSGMCETLNIIADELDLISNKTSSEHIREAIRCIK